LSRFLKLTSTFVVDLRRLLTSDGCTGSFSRTCLVGLPILLLCTTVHLSASSDALVLVNGVLLLVEAGCHAGLLSRIFDCGGLLTDDIQN
jgi:hypothetical protein